MSQEPGQETRKTCLPYVVTAIVVGVLILLLFPWPESRPGYRMQCSNNLKQIGLALHNYYDKYRVLPPAYTTDPNGKPLHSWRSLILPFMEMQDLYNQIRFDEPWNSDHNRRFAEMPMPGYACSKAPGKLAYLAITIPDGIFEGTCSRTFADIADGTGNTVFVMEVVPRAVSWMEPVDFDQQDFDQALAHGLASEHPGGAQVVFADGSVRFLPATIKPENLRSILTRSGGEDVPLDDAY